MTPRPRLHFTHALLAALLALAAALSAALAAPPHALASQTQVSMIESDSLLFADPMPTLLRLRQLGIEDVRLDVRWESIAPDPNARKPPSGFNGANPAAYPAAAWAPYDAIDEDAAAEGITVDMDLSGNAPLWATGPGQPGHGNWEPNPAAFGAFARAVAIRYGGSFDPASHRLAPGNPSDLPRIDFWSIWNEPNYGPSLAPQGLPGATNVPDSPRIYRALVDQAWSALHAAGHGSDTILIGELAPRSNKTTPFAFKDFNGMLPLVFLQALYCVNGRYQPLRGAAATIVGCPPTAAGSARFAASNPGLFDASGFSDHPYMRWFPPNDEENAPKLSDFKQALADYTTFATIGHLETALNRVVAAYGSHTVFPIWDTEFGYITTPPKRHTKKDPYPWVSQATAAYYDNWAEYLSWKDPRIMSFDQYLLEDPSVPLASNDYGGFASGLLAYNARQKPGYGAFRLPLFLPTTTDPSPADYLQVWGAAKPVHFAQLDDPTEPDFATILFEPQGASTYEVLDEVPITSPEGYFDTYLQFPSSGTVVLQWTYPDDSLLAAPGVAVYSRHVQVTVK